MTKTIREAEEKKSMCSVELKEKIDLTEKEREIFDRLLGTLLFCNLDSQLRVAGGWVRDKLLGKDSNDINIAIDNMSGRDFRDKLREYLSSRDEEVHGVPFECNPLKTAKIRIYDQWIDFDKLRRDEEYTEYSRTPRVEFGTAKEDAYRRDLTINSLFYNISTGSVEDLTGRGIDDLKSGRIVTPLPAKTMFLDDPLRLFRAIRFGAAFCFTLDEEIKEAGSTEEVRIALRRKVRRVQIGNEIDLMLSGNGPVSAITHISDMKLFLVVFSLPFVPIPEPSKNCGSLCQASLEAVWSLNQTLGLGTLSGERRRLGLYAALFLPFRKIVYIDHSQTGKGHPEITPDEPSYYSYLPAVNHILNFSLRRKSSDAEMVMNIYTTAERFLSLISPLKSKNYSAFAFANWEFGELDWANDALEYWNSTVYAMDAVPEARKFTAFLLSKVKDLWRVTLLISLLLSTVDCMNEDQEIGHLDSQLLDEVREMYPIIEEAIREQGLGLTMTVEDMSESDEEEEEDADVLAEEKKVRLTLVILFAVINWLRVITLPLFFQPSGSSLVFEGEFMTIERCGTLSFSISMASLAMAGWNQHIDNRMKCYGYSMISASAISVAYSVMGLVYKTPSSLTSPTALQEVAALMFTVVLNLAMELLPAEFSVRDYMNQLSPMLVSFL